MIRPSRPPKSSMGMFYMRGLRAKMANSAIMDLIYYT